MVLPSAQLTLKEVLDSLRPARSALDSLPRWGGRGSVPARPRQAI